MSKKSKALRPFVESGSMSDVLLHFIYMYSRTTAYTDPTSSELYTINAARYKKKDNLERALSRLLKMKLVNFYSHADGKRYFITDRGIDCVYRLAALRKRREIKHKRDAGINSTNFKYGYDELL